MACKADSGVNAISVRGARHAATRQRARGEDLVPACIRDLIPVDGGDAGVLQQLESVESARVIDAALQHDVVRHLAAAQFEDDVPVVDTPEISSSLFERREEQLLLDTHARIQDPYIHSPTPGELFQPYLFT